ncbi:ribonuclease J [Ammoniphilus oxalaticus]|uniref:Ribonuclease J n=1 Tax=Ammoniphilus oxalaticus TaxID=66863 RepID=A0A419SJX8_9BACL|nr:ribonuclease J [Ammoniphilus oxalaticus]RKD24287.1 ribonuclease J [Ammoniphilus oxalaticus]
MLKHDNKVLSIFALGGVGEIGKNMYVVQYDNEILVIDAGLKFPDAGMLGIDLVIPDISYLMEHKEKVKGVLITHGHEDHIGGLSYFLKNINVPVYASKLTVGLIKGKLREAGILRNTTLHVVDSHSKVSFQYLKASFFRTTHSIPDSLGVCIDTPEGKVVYTGDFKFDQTPVDRNSSDFAAMSRLGDEGVLALLSDSTNADKPGFTGSEWEVGQAIGRVFSHATGRIIFATFASNIHRIQQVFDAAARFGRKVAIVGKSMKNVTKIAHELGYLQFENDILLEPEEIQRLPVDQIVILATGSQGEPMSALNRMARSAHRKADVMPGDTVVIASTPIPGNERHVGRVIDQLFRIGADVIYGPDIHVSGHGSQEELKLMLNLMKPKYFIPVHGEFRMMRAHARIAEQVGVLPGNIFLLNNGDTVEIVDQDARQGGAVHAGQVLIDGLGVGDVGNIVLRDRKLLSEDGILVIVVTLCRRTGKILSGPNIISRGFVYVRESEELLDEANQLVSQTLAQCHADQVKEWSSLKSNVRDALSRFLYDQTRRRPMILPIIMEA